MSKSDFEATRSATNRPQRMPRWRGLAAAVIVGVLLIVLQRFVTQARESARRTSCNCQLKQLGLALHNYHDTYGSFPPAFVLGPDGQPWHSWRVLILPFLDQTKLHAQYRFDEPWDGPNNRKLLASTPEAFVCLSRPTPTGPTPSGTAPLLAIGVLACASASGGPSVSSGYTSYAAVLGQDCVFRGIVSVNLTEVLDGTSSTAMIGECTGTKIPWTKPEDIFVPEHPKLGDPDGFSSPHGNGAQFLFADGHVKWLSSDLPQDTVDAIFTRAGGERLNEF